MPGINNTHTHPLVWHRPQEVMFHPWNRPTLFFCKSFHLPQSLSLSAPSVAPPLSVSLFFYFFLSLLSFIGIESGIQFGSVIKFSSPLLTRLSPHRVGGREWGRSEWQLNPLRYAQQTRDLLLLQFSHIAATPPTTTQTNKWYRF